MPDIHPRITRHKNQKEKSTRDKQGLAQMWELESESITAYYNCIACAPRDKQRNPRCKPFSCRPSPQRKLQPQTVHQAVKEDTMPSPLQKTGQESTTLFAKSSQLSQAISATSNLENTAQKHYWPACLMNTDTHMLNRSSKQKPAISQKTNTKWPVIFTKQDRLSTVLTKLKHRRSG